MMTDQAAEAKIDHAYACGMQQALKMAAQGADERAREIAESRMSEALRVIRANGGEGMTDEPEAMLELADRFDRDPVAWAFSNAMTKAEKQIVAKALRTAAHAEADTAMREALKLALVLLYKYELPDSRAVSDEFIALAAVECGVATPNDTAVIRKALAALSKSAPEQN